MPSESLTTTTRTDIIRAVGSAVLTKPFGNMTTGRQYLKKYCFSVILKLKEVLYNGADYSINK